ncbi:MAG: cryptochrome/photolyase family protein [Planctomycetota bacterium]
MTVGTGASVILLVFPHQLFAKHPGLQQRKGDEVPERIILIEDSLFFGDAHHPAKFHKQKLWLHRSTMKRYGEMLSKKGHDVKYVKFDSEKSLTEQLEKNVPKSKRKTHDLAAADPVDFLLEKRLKRAAKSLGMDLRLLPTPGFLNTRQENAEYRKGKKRWFMADFYKWQRTRFDILMDGDEPVGGQWSFDESNRKKVPKKLLGSIPKLEFPQKRNEIETGAVESVENDFADNPGKLDTLLYPTDHVSAKKWLKCFLSQRFGLFGDYEDAIVEGQSWLWHSVLTPMMNTGLLTPKEVIKATTDFIDDHDVPLNSAEGFIRQVIGWREFMRATYEDLGVKMRTTNHWKHHRAMPQCFYDGSSGIEPVDDAIQRALETGYCHHIERLMVLGGFFFLCEIDPDDIYRWFMEMFVDSYDWVMVPNAYAMSQNADGGLITTKPYFSGSSYVKKMSNHKSGPWCDVWDGLYWRWIWNHHDELARNPRWAMMCSMAKKMETRKRNQHIKNAEEFLRRLDGN